MEGGETMKFFTKNKKKILAVIGVIALVAIVAPMGVLAQNQSGPSGNISDYDYFEDTTDLELGDADLIDTAVNLINIVLGLLGLVAVVIIMLGGFKWMTAQGSEDKIGEAQNLIKGGVIGLAIVLFSYAIARFVVDKLSDATDTGA